MKPISNTDSSALELVDSTCIHYNCRVDQGINQTPANAANSNLNPLQDRGESLMRQKVIHNKDVIVQPFVKGLGISMQKLLIISEKDCMKIQPKSRLDINEWCEIHSILSRQGFNLLANGKNSYWIKMHVEKQVSA